MHILNRAVLNRRTFLRAGAVSVGLPLLDAMIPDYGGNEFNLAPVSDRVRVNYCDIRDDSAVSYLVRDRDYIFHLAGQVCHLMSLSNPFPDIDMNITGTAILMEACRKFNKDAVVVYTGTRGQYGPSVSGGSFFKMGSSSSAALGWSRFAKN